MPQDVKFDIKARNRTDSAFDKVKKNLSGTTAGVAKLAGGVVSLLGIGAFGLMAKETLKMGDEVHKLSIRLGASTEALSQLRHVANLSGVDFKVLSKAMQQMIRTTSEAAQGLGTGVDAFKELGLSAKKLNELKPEQQLEVIADAMKGVGNQADKVRLAEKLFGAKGASVLQLMDQGAEGIRKMRQEADELGLTLGQEGANNIAAFNDQMAKLKARFEGLVQIIVVKLGPTLESLAEFFTAGIPQAINITIKAFRILSLGLGVIVEKVTTGLIRFYGVLARVPKFGEPYRKAAQDLRDFRTDLESVNLELAKSVLEAPKFTVEQGKPSDFAPLVEPEGLVIDRVKIDKDAEKLAREEELAKIKEEREIASLLATEERELESFSRRIEALNLSMLTERELLEVDLSEKENLINEAIGRGIISEEQGKLKIFKINARFQNSLTKLEKKSNKERLKFDELTLNNKIKFVAASFSAITAISSTESKTLFNINKSAAVANATIAGIESVVTSFAKGSEIGGPYVGAAFAAVAAAFQFAQISSLASTSFTGGGGGSISSGSVGAPTVPTVTSILEDQEPTAILDPASTGDTPAAQGFTINFVGGTFLGGSKDELARELAPSIRKAVFDGV